METCMWCGRDIKDFHDDNVWRDVYGYSDCTVFVYHEPSRKVRAPR